MCFCVCGVVSGFGAGRLFAFFHGTDWVALSFMTALTFPLVFGIAFLAIDICEFIETKRFTTISVPEGLIMMTFFIAVNIPSNFLGCFFGYKMKTITIPTKVNRVARDPPADLPWFLKRRVMAFLSGMLPVFVICFELSQIWQCIKGSGYITIVYWSFYVAFVIFTIVVAQISVMSTYLLICYEDYRWWWRCWALGASTGFFLFCLLVNYFILALKVSSITTLIVYGIFAGLFSLSMSLMTGSIALLASFIFNVEIYKKIKHSD